MEFEKISVVGINTQTFVNMCAKDLRSATEGVHYFGKFEDF